MVCLLSSNKCKYIVDFFVEKTDELLCITEVKHEMFSILPKSEVLFYITCEMKCSIIYEFERCVRGGRVNGALQSDVLKCVFPSQD